MKIDHSAATVNWSVKKIRSQITTYTEIIPEQESKQLICRARGGYFYTPMKNRLLLPVIVVLILLGGVAGIVIHQHNQAAAPTVSVSATPLAVATVQGEDGKTALELLQAKYTVVTQTFSFGKEITAIDGHQADSKHYWEFMVNGTDATVGADSYTAKAGDTITFKYASL